MNIVIYKLEFICIFYLFFYYIMHFLIDNKRKILFGWSAKCGCSHIKNIYWFLQTDNLTNNIHNPEEWKGLPKDIKNYTTIIICRNPYKRIISGFLDKYRKSGEFRKLWKHNTISFSKFVDQVIKSNWKVIQKHHFIQQTKEKFDRKILSSKIIKFYDISNIDYKYIEELYEKKIPECVINKREGHERNNRITKFENYEKPVYDLDMDEYVDYHVDTKYFYNEEIMKKVFEFYKDDFNFFYENGVDYINNPY